MVRRVMGLRVWLLRVRGRCRRAMFFRVRSCLSEVRFFQRGWRYRNLRGRVRILLLLLLMLSLLQLLLLSHLLFRSLLFFL